MQFCYDKITLFKNEVALANDRESSLPEQPPLPFKEDLVGLIQPRRRFDFLPWLSLLSLTLTVGAWVLFLSTLAGPDLPTPKPPVLVEEMIDEIKIGELPAIAEDILIGEAEDLMFPDRRIIISHPVGGYLTKIMFSLAATPAAANGYRLQIKLHDDRWTRIPEARISANGTIYFGVSLIFRAHNEAEIAGILAHEIGHAVCRHYAKDRLYKKNITQLYDHFLRNGDIGKMHVLDDAVLRLYGIPDRRVPGTLEDQFQMEADRQAQDILTEAGYDFSGMFNAIKDFAIGVRLDYLRKCSQDYYKTHAPGKLFILSSEKELKEMQSSLRQFLGEKR